MNENTLKVRIAETEKKLSESLNGTEQAILSDQLKEYKRQLSTLNVTRKEPELKTNIDAPIIGDREKKGQSFIKSVSGDTFIAHI